MDRRGFLAGGAALAQFAAFPAFADPDDLRTAAREAWLYGLPLIESARLRTAAIGPAPQEGTPGFNSFAHMRVPAGPGNRDMSAVEADVLYSTAWIHLGGGPATISLPPTQGRYVSLALFDLYGDVIAVVEGREAAKTGHEITVIGPPSRVGVAGYTAPMPRMPELHKMVHTRGYWVWALARVHLEGDHDLASAQAVQGALAVHVKPVKTPPRPVQPVGRDAAWNDYFYAAQQLIDENPPPPEDEAFFRRIAPIQLGMYGGFEKARFADAELGEITRGVGEAQTLVSSPPEGDQIGGAVYPKPNLGAFGQDFLYRAQTALTQPAAPPPQVVTALRLVGPDGARTFLGNRRHRVLLTEPPPAAGFWSLTLYHAEPDGRLFLPQTGAGRASVGAWTPGLRRREGPIEVTIGRGGPDSARGGAWLPAPDGAPFALVLRAYAPGDDILKRRYRVPPVEAL
ncbi:MAG TPA: DUF1254 domain-containing protein [Caulobacteraceae bacterium]|nr:DUF1254 domain-containing protein [Caulobacteraceae bacterium]